MEVLRKVRVRRIYFATIYVYALNLLTHYRRSRDGL